MKKWYQKWWVWLLIIILLVILVIIRLFLVSKAISPMNNVGSIMDAKRQSDLKNIASKANAFCYEMRRCPASLEELLEKDYMGEIPNDPDNNDSYSYEITESGNNCILKATLSTKEIVSLKCITSKAP